MKRIALLFTLWLAFAMSANAVRIDIIVPPNSAAHADLAKAARHAMLQRDDSLQINITDVGADNPAEADLAIPIGDLLLPWSSSSANNYSATLCFYVSSSRYATTVGSRRDVTALFRDQPLERQLKLAALLLPHNARLAMLYGSDGPPPGFQLLTATDGAITAIDVSGRSDWPRAVSELMVNHDALIAIDDSALYNRDTIRSVLLTTYRHGRVVIGPNRPFVNAGSLASAYTASDQYLKQLTDTVFAFLRQRTLPTPAYPSAFRVAVNRQVADSLNLKIPNENELTERLQRSYLHLGQECSDGC